MTGMWRKVRELREQLIHCVVLHPSQVSLGFMTLQFIASIHAHLLLLL